MIQENLENKLPNEIMISGEILAEIVQYLPHLAHVKDVKSGEYVLSNSENAKIYGITKSEEILGKTVHDLDRTMRPKWGTAYAKVIDHLDYDVHDKNATVIDKNRVLVNSEGLLRLQTMVKIPAKGFDNKTKAILTFSYDFLDRLNYYELFQLYLTKYSKKSDGIHYFLKHFHHYPYFGMRGEQDFIELTNFFRITQQLHLKEFGEYIFSFESEDE